MTNAERGAFARLLLALAETFNEPLSETRADVYFDVLKPYPLEAVQRAAHRLLRTSVFFPKPAEFVKLLEGDAADQGEMALARITEEVRRVGYYGRPALSAGDQALVQQVWGGWGRLCESLPAKGTEAFQWERKRFLEFHAARAAQAACEHPVLTSGEATKLLEDIKGHVRTMEP